MRSARHSAIRLLQLMMVASLVLPAVLFAFAAWINYRYAHAVADERIERSLDILHEHTLKVIETVQRAIAEVNEVTRPMSDNEIRAAQPWLAERLKRIVASMPHTQAIIVMDRSGHALASSYAIPVDGSVGFSDRDYFKALASGEVGTFVSEVLTPRLPGLGTYFFTVAQRRSSPDGSFQGIVGVAVLPSYFNEFYSRIGHSSGSYYALARADGRLLARFPVTADPERNALNARSALLVGIAGGLDQDMYTVNAQVDGVERRIGYRKLAGFPLYVLAGTEISAINAEWFSTMASHLIFGLPATLLLFGIVGLALQRTRRLHEEAERREAAEGALRQAQRLEAIGQLTGGVAHDFNNLLMIVGGSVQRLRRELTDPKHARLLDMITTAAQRGESLTRQLLTFARRQTLTPSVIDLKERLPELKEMLGRSLGGDIETEVIAPKDSCAVKVDASELELALLNLAVNARDAMPNGGRLAITARPVLLKGKAVEEGLRGEFVAIRVADTGTGIAPDVLPHVVEPFFTTKEVGKGTGLGLSQVYGFARQSGGTATISSTLGKGTVITLYLPRTREAPAAAPSTAEMEAPARHAGAVLLVEDYEAVAEVANSYFQQLGYVVKQAASAQQALELLENEPGVDLVFSDILMPGVMNGLDLALAVRARFPGLPVLLCTGFSRSAQDAVRQGFIVVQKPFDLTALQQALHEVRHPQKAPPPALN